MLLALLLAASPTADANAAGMKLYQAKKYPEAVDQFRKAIKLGDEEKAADTKKEQVQLLRVRALARFNLACTLALLRKAGRVCEFDAYRSTIAGHVEESIALDPNRLEKALADPDLAGLRDTIVFQSWAGLSPKREADLPKLLVAVKWWSRGVGVYGSMSQLTFSPNGSVTESSMVLDAEGAPQPRRKSSVGKWTLSGRTLRLVFPDALPGPKKTTVEGTFDDVGELQFKDWTTFSDQPSECDA